MAKYILNAKAPDNHTVTTSSTPVLSQDDSRVMVWLTNDSDTDVYLGFGGNAAVAGKGHLLGKNGGFLEIDFNDKIFNGAITAIHAGAGSKNICVQEFLAA